MTAFYSFRLIFKVFHGTYNGDYDYNKIHESGIFMILPLVILSIGAIFAGYFFNNILSGYNAEEFWNEIIFLSKEKHHYSSFFPIFSKTLIAIGIALAVYFYGFNQAKLKDLKKQFVNIYQFILNKWYFDELYDKIFVKPIYNLGKFLWSKIDQGLIDRFLPNGSASIVASVAKACKKIQTGFIFDYTFIIITGFTLFISIIFYVSVS
jgi:NADH-quinone oxidoreductase subunit L